MDAGNSLLDEQLFLLGRPPIGDYMRFLRTRVFDFRPGELAAHYEEWRRVERHIETLQETEKGRADHVEFMPLPEEMQPLAQQALQAPPARRASQYASRRWCMVEIDNLIVYQRTINLTFVEHIKALLPAVPTALDLIRIASGQGEVRPSMQVMQGADGAYYFASPSNDLQFLDVVPLDPGSISGYEPSGSAATALVVYVGFGLNYISAFRAHGRLVLNNGSHRAYALRSLGITHIPCLVADASGTVEFDLVAPAELKQDRHQYLATARPPLFKDYFDPQLCKPVRTKRRSQVLQLQCNFNRMDVPAV